MPDRTSSTHGLTGTLLLIALAFTVLMGAVYLVHPSFVRSATYRATDAVMSLAGPGEGSGRVAIVDIDEKSLARFGHWPWSRDLLARLLDAVRGAGAAGVGLDLILAEPERTAAGPVPRGGARGSGGAFSAEAAAPGESDLRLAQVLSRGGCVLGYEFLFGNHLKMTPDATLHPPGIVRVDRAPAGRRRAPDFFQAQGVVGNLPVLSRAVSRSGFLNATPDADGILRRVPVLIRYGVDLYPSLALALLLQREGASQIQVVGGAGDALELRVGDRTVRTDRQGNLALRFGGRPALRVSAADLLRGSVDSSLLKGKTVLVGFSAAGLEARYHTAAGPVRSHVEVHAQALDNLLSGEAVLRGGKSALWEVAAALLVAAAMALAAAGLRLVPGIAVCAAAVAASWLVAVVIFRQTGQLFSPLFPTTAAWSTFALLTLAKSWKLQHEARQRAEEALLLLLSSEKSLDSIIRSVPDIIFRLDAAGRITFISPAVTRYRTSPEELLGRPILDLVDPADLPKASHRLTEKRTGERATRHLELRLLLPHQAGEGGEEGGYFVVSAEGLYRGDTPRSDDFIGTQGIIRDVTEQKKLEERLVAAQKLEAIGSLAAGVAHDLNNILVGLVTYPELLMLELPPESPLREKIALLQRSGQRAAAIVQDLLTLARRGVNVAEVVNLNGIVADYLASPEFEVCWRGYPGVALAQNLAPDLLDVRGSRVHLSKVVMNLVNNAAEAMPAGGTITLSTFNRYLDAPLERYERIPAGEYVCIEVADEGVGIAPQDLHRIFEPFYSRKSMRRSGSGLGMTVIWSTVKDHEGYIDLASREGDGTSIVLYLPATRERQVSSPRVVLENYLGTERLLIVDDMPDQLQIAAGMLRKLGYQVSTAESGESAVQYLESQSVDLVVLDMIMPGGMDGLETYRRIAELWPGQRAVITSGFSESERVKALQRLGAGGYVQKPYTMEKIGVAIRKELDREEKCGEQG